jgi:DNA-binding CsgD family transcriptional regulator
MRQFLDKAKAVLYLFSCAPTENALSAEPAPALRRDRSLAARSEARRKKAERQMRIVGFLNGGESIAEIAAREGVTERGMRKHVRGLLARRAPEPPEAFMALQVSRLHEALTVAYGAMSGANLQAVDRVVKLVRELDRYHGFPSAEPAPSLAPPTPAPLALKAPGARTEPHGAASP